MKAQRYSATPMSLAEGEIAEHTPVDPSGAIRVAETAGPAGKTESVSRLLSSAASTNATSVKASAGTVKYLTGMSAVGANRFIKLYNKATAPDVGTDVPVATICIPAGVAFHLPLDLYFSTGIGFAITGAAADADTTAIAAGDIICLNVGYA